MSNRRHKVRDAPATSPPQTRSGWLSIASSGMYDMACHSGYTRLVDCPEIQTAVNRVADLISSMTIHLMSNTKDGDIRLRNELSRKIDINPNKWTTRKAWMYSIVRNIMLDGDGNCVQIPHFTADGFLDDLEPLDMSGVGIVKDYPYGYHIEAGGRRFAPDEVLHFIDNPDPRCPWIGTGYRVLLKDIASNLKQAQHTKGEFMAQPAPSLIIRVDGLTEEFASKEGRDELQKQYFESAGNGRPWLIPSELADVQQIKPLSIRDLAINDSVSIDKRTAAAIFGTPAFLVGEGDFDRDTFNNYVSAIVLPKARGIEQELTRKLLISPDWFFRFNPRSLYSYSLTEISEVACNYVDRAIIDRNEARDWSGWTPREGLSELAILENYIPYSKIGEQQKLKGQQKQQQQNGGDAGG